MVVSLPVRKHQLEMAHLREIPTRFEGEANASLEHRQMALPQHSLKRLQTKKTEHRLGFLKVRGVVLLRKTYNNRRLRD